MSKDEGKTWCGCFDNTCCEHVEEEGGICGNSRWPSQVWRVIAPTMEQGQQLFPLSWLLNQESLQCIWITVLHIRERGNIMGFAWRIHYQPWHDIFFTILSPTPTTSPSCPQYFYFNKIFIVCYHHSDPTCQGWTPRYNFKDKKVSKQLFESTIPNQKPHGWDAWGPEISLVVLLSPSLVLPSMWHATL